MEIDQRIAHLSHEINKMMSEYAELDMRKIKNTFVTETGEIELLSDPDELDREIADVKEILNEELFELDQAIGERDGMASE